MALFHSERYFPIPVRDLTPIGKDLVEHFRVKGFEVTGEPTVSRGWFVSIHKGGTFKAVLGMKTALNVELEPVGSGFTAKASIGIFGMHIVPALLTKFVYFPLILPEMWGLVHQARLDNEALDAVAESAATHAGESISAGPVAGGVPQTKQFCMKCGSKLADTDKFCTACGAAV